MEREEILATIRGLSDIIKRDYRAKVIGLFGSFARGEEKASSDIDLLVIFDEEADLFDFVGLSLFLEEKLGRKVDVVPYETVRPELKENIFKETVPV